MAMFVDVCTVIWITLGSYPAVCCVPFDGIHVALLSFLIGIEIEFSVTEVHVYSFSKE